MVFHHLQICKLFLLQDVQAFEIKGHQGVNVGHYTLENIQKFEVNFFKWSFQDFNWNGYDVVFLNHIQWLVFKFVTVVLYC